MAAAEVVNAERTMLLSEIHADYATNCRSKARATSTEEHESFDDGDKNTPGVNGLADSMETQGQDTPVDIRTNEKGKIELVAGFRRYTAVKLLEKAGKSVMGLKLGHIRVKDHGKLSDRAARSLNLRENVARENLIGADLAFGVKRLQQSDEKLTAKQIATDIGKSYAYVQTLLNIATKTKPVVFNAWRESPVRTVSVSDMAEIADMPEDKQEAEFASRTAQKKTADKGPDAWKGTAKKQAEKIGLMLGELEREGFLKKDQRKTFDDYIRNILKFKVKQKSGKLVSQKTVHSIAEACEKGYLKGLETPEKEAVEVVEEED